jgi:hypothetical protein
VRAAHRRLCAAARPSVRTVVLSPCGGIKKEKRKQRHRRTRDDRETKTETDRGANLIVDLRKCSLHGLLRRALLRTFSLHADAIAASHARLCRSLRRPWLTNVAVGTLAYVRATSVLRATSRSSPPLRACCVTLAHLVAGFCVAGSGASVPMCAGLFVPPQRTTMLTWRNC